MAGDAGVGEAGPGALLDEVVGVADARGVHADEDLCRGGGSEGEGDDVPGRVGGGAADFGTGE